MISQGSVPQNDAEKAKEERPTENLDGGDRNDGDRESKKPKTEEAEEEHVELPSDIEILVRLKYYLRRTNMKYPSPDNYPELITFAHEWNPVLHPGRIIDRIETVRTNYFDYLGALSGLPGEEGSQGDVFFSPILEGLCREIWEPHGLC